MMRLLPRVMGRALRHLNKRLVQLQNDYLRAGFVLGRPFQLTLEPGNVCNLACPLCATTHRERDLPTGLLSAKTAARILKAFPWTIQLVLSNWGEPLLNEEIFEIIELAKQRDVRVRLESHLNLLDEQEARALIDSGLDTLVVALDGTTQETYERYRVGGRLDRAISHVELLRRIQDEQADQRTTIVWKFVIHSGNEHQVEEARAWAARLGLDFEAVPIWTPPGDQEWTPKGDPERGHRSTSGAPARCHNLWQAVSVNFNGDVFPCCSEFSPEDRLLNVLEDPFGPVWNSSEYRERRAHNKGPVDCTRCHLDRDTNWAKKWMPDTLRDS